MTPVELSNKDHTYSDPQHIRFLSPAENDGVDYEVDLLIAV